MKLKFYLLFSILLFRFANSYCQFSQTVRGEITDKETRRPVVGARIVLVGSNPMIAVLTNTDGKFNIENVPIGRHDFKINYLGYQEIVIPNVEVNSGKQCIINAELEEEVTQEVVIKAEKTKDKPLNDMAVTSTRTFTIEETQRYAGALGDPARMAGNFAGVSGSNDSRNDIIIRGNSPSGLLWRLEGVDIPSPNHFAAQGTTGGPVSILNNNVLSNSDFFTGAWPAEYGDATSGVFDLKMRSGNNEKYEYTGQVGFNGFEGMAEGPINKSTGSSFLASYRYSALGIFQAVGINLGPAGVPYYQDLSFKINLPTEKYGQFQVFGIGGISDISILAKNLKPGNFTYGQNNRNVYFGSGMGAIGVEHFWPVGNSGYIKTVLSGSVENHNTKVDTLDTHLNPFNFYNEHADYYRTTIHSMFNQRIDGLNTIRAGIIFTRTDFTLHQNYYYNIIHSWLDLTHANGSLYFGQAYAELKHNFTERLYLLAGMQYEYQFLNNTYSIEPRAGLKYSLNNISSISLGYGIHGQIQQMETYFTQTQIPGTNNYTLTNKDLGFTKSEHFVLGYDRSLGKDFRLKFETYYQYLFNVPVTIAKSSYSTLNFGDSYGVYLPDSLTNKGTGRNYGMELTIEKYYSSGYYFLITGSLFDSKYTASDGVERNTAFNSKFTTNVLGGYEFKIDQTGNSLININGKCTFAGGRYFTPIDLALSEQYGQFYPDVTKSYTQRYPDYFILDMKVGYKWNGKKVTQEWALDVQNVTNQKNILTEDYNPTTRSVVNDYQLSIFPMILYKIQF